MSLLTLVHALAVGALLLLAGRLAESGLRRLGVPARGVWLVLVVTTVSAPVWGPLAGGLIDGAGLGASPGASLDLMTVLLSRADTSPEGGPAATALNQARGWIGPGWMGLAALGVLLVGTGLFRLQRRARRWPRARIGDEPVLLSPDFGPAVVGLRRPRTVLPGWSLGLESAELELVVRHEAEHRKARDPLVLAAGVFTAALAPWNPFLWLQVRRLREAVEQDCDRRLLRAGVPRIAYARMLLSMRARGTVPGALPVPGLRDTRDSLERRLTTMWTRPSIRRALPALLGSVLLMAVACEGPSPTVVAPERSSAEALDAAGAVVEVEATPDAPDPLIVVDGEPREGAIALLEADDIHSVHVLKGPAAVERYGEAGRDGVVEVVTKAAAGATALPREPTPPTEVAGAVAPRSIVERAPSPPDGARVDEVPPPPPATGSPRSEVRIRARPSTGAVRVEALPPEEPAAAGIVRGLRSRTGAAPLVFVDGVAVDGVPADLAPESIERVEVIKGAAAVRIYGEDARDGVIQITTKRRGG
jgi:hypothetical protein